MYGGTARNYGGVEEVVQQSNKKENPK